MSASGVAVSADIVPDIGTPLAVGTVVGKAVRHCAPALRGAAFVEVASAVKKEMLLVIEALRTVTTIDLKSSRARHNSDLSRLALLTTAEDDLDHLSILN